MPTTRMERMIHLELWDSRLIWRRMGSTESLRSLLTSTLLPDTPTSVLTHMVITAWARTQDNCPRRLTRYTACTISSSDLMAASTRSTTYKRTPQLDFSASITVEAVSAQGPGSGIQATISPPAAAIRWQAS